MHDKPKSSQESPEPQLRKISQEELDGLLREHGYFLELYDEEAGSPFHDEPDDPKRLSLKHVDLRGLVFNTTDLRYVDFISSGLRKLNLMGFDFSDASFLRSDLRNASFMNCNLSRAKFHETDVRDTTLAHANLTKADLFKANFEKASLYRADLAEANVHSALFFGAELAEAKMADVVGLKSDALAGANVTGAKLPEDIKSFEGLKYISGAASNAAKLFTALLAACLYCGIILAGLIGESAWEKKVKLPVVGVEIFMEWFLFLAPMILIALYLYMHLYLQNIWEAFAGLPAVFQDGTELHKKASAWLPLGFARAFSPRLRDGRRAVGVINHLLTMFLLWMVAPLTVMFFLITGIHIGGNHRLQMVLVQGGLLLIATVAAMYFHYQASATLSLYAMKTREYSERFLADMDQDFSYQTLRKELILFLAIFLGLMGLIFAIDFITSG